MMRGDSRKPSAGASRRTVLAGLLAVLVAGPAHAQLWRDRQERRQDRRERRQERREDRRERMLDRQDDPDERWLSRRERWLDVREAVRRGEIHPLRDLMRHFEGETGYEIIDIRYRKVADRHFYGFKVLTDRGRLRWFVIDAATREIMTMQEALARYGE